MVRRRVKERLKGVCKYHPEVEAVKNVNGQSTGMCPECLSRFGRRGAVNKWQKPEAQPAERKFTWNEWKVRQTLADPGTEIPERIADAVVSLARPGAEQQVLELYMADLKIKAAGLVRIMAKGEAA